MPIDPLQTDEKLDKPVKAGKDFDAQMMFGCGGFLIAAVAGYMLSVWPFFAFQNVEQLSVLLLAMAVGMGPATALGLFATRKFGVAGACGFLAGAITTAIFLYLRLTQAHLSAMAQQSPRPDWPQVMAVLIPISWVLLVAFLGLLFMPKGEL